MSGEIQIGIDTTALTLYAHVWSAVGTIWNGAAFEAYLTANIATYKIAMTEKGTASRFYVATFPAAAAGTYQVTVQQQAGGSPAESDVFLGEGSYEWDGAALVPVSSRLATSGYTAPDNADIVLIKAKTDLIPAGGPPAASDYTPARAVKLDNLDATISSRSTLAAGAAMTLTAAYDDAKTAAQAGDAMTLTPAERDDIADAVLAAAVELGISVKAAMRLILSACAGKVSGVQLGTPVFRSADDSADRIAATVDVNNNRTAVVLTPGV